MNLKKLDGRIEGDAIVWGEPASGLQITKAISVSVPNLRNCQSGLLSQLQRELSTLLLRDIGGGVSLQVKLDSYTADDEKKLAEYYLNTCGNLTNRWSQSQRDYLYIAFSQALAEGKIRTKGATFYFTIQLDVSLKLKDHDVLVEAAKKRLDNVLVEVIRGFERVGGTARGMREEGLQAALQGHFNAEMREVSFKSKIPYDASKNIFGNCLQGFANKASAEKGYLKAGDYFHAFVALKDLPQVTAPNLMLGLCNLPFGEYSINLNIDAADKEKIIASEQRQISKMQRASLTSKQGPSLGQSIQTKKTRIERLLSGQVGAYYMQYTVHIWAKSEEELNERVSIVRSAMIALQGAKPEVVALPASQRNALFLCMPGSQYRNKAYRHYIEDINLSDMIPVAANRAQTDTAYQALFFALKEGAMHGVNLFKAGAPLHTYIDGATNMGKSCGQIALLTQTQAHWDKLYIVDVGMSYASYVRTFPGNVRTLMVEAYGEETFNYMSTQGNAYSGYHQDFVTKILCHMTGGFIEQENYHESLYFKYVRGFFIEWGERWVSRDESRKAISWEDAYAYMNEQEEQPTHKDFYLWLEAKQEVETRNAEDLQKLVLLLGRWCRDQGGYTLFDGPGTVSMNAQTDVIHIELSKLSDADPTLKKVANFVLSGIIRAQILSLPKNLRKVVIFEEMGALLQIPGCEAILKDFFQRMRKYNACVLATIQQLASIPESLAIAILGNISQAFIFGQKSPMAVSTLKKAFNLSEHVATTLLSLDRPNPEKGAEFLHIDLSGDRTQAVFANSIVSDEQLYMMSTSGEDSEARDKDLAAYDDPIKGIFEGAAKKKAEELRINSA